MTLPGDKSEPEVPVEGNDSVVDPAEDGGAAGLTPSEGLEAGETVLVSAEELAEYQKRSGERDLYLNELLRAKADLDNYQKRVRKDRAVWEERTEARLLQQLLGVMDDFDRALGAMEQGGANVSLLLDGVRMTQQTFRNVLAERDVDEIPALGEPFNPELHEAVMEEAVSDRPTGEVLDVLQKGYRMKNTVLRPSKVKVARNTESE